MCYRPSKNLDAFKLKWATLCHNHCRWYKLHTILTKFSSIAMQISKYVIERWSDVSKNWKTYNWNYCIVLILNNIGWNCCKIASERCHPKKCHSHNESTLISAREYITCTLESTATVKEEEIEREGKISKWKYFIVIKFASCIYPSVNYI